MKLYNRIRAEHSLLKSIKIYFGMLFCEHNFICDTQIIFLICTKCGIEHSFKYDKTAFRIRKINKLTTRNAK